MAKAKQRHAVWVVTTRNFDNGMSETEFSPHMSPAKEEAYMKAHGLKDKGKNKMPLKYDPDTGIPSYVPDLGEELEEGVTPEPTVITSKSDVFKGDKPLTKQQYYEAKSEKLEGEPYGFVEKKPMIVPAKGIVSMGSSDEKSEALGDPSIVMKHTGINAGEPLTQEQYEKLRAQQIPVHSEMGSDEADKLLEDALRNAKPGRLDKDFATDEEVGHLERLASERNVMHWPTLLRLINRLRRAEGK